MVDRKKALLVTMQDNNNIGNRLQNYALQTILEKNNLEVSNLDNGYRTVPLSSIGSKIKLLIKYTLGLLGLSKYKKSALFDRNNKVRYLENKKFTDDYIHDIVKVTYDNVFHKEWESVDIGFVGSDQVWHRWKNEDGELPYYYLEFLPKKKRVAYAASFGFDSFPIEDKKQHINGLKGMNYISCRESTGCNLVKNAIGKTVPHVLDPTLLLSANDWHNLASDSNDYARQQKNYLFIYFLGDISEEYEAEIKSIARKKRLKIIDFMNLTDENIAKCGPKEFISLIENASYVLTDSFHCCVFSVLFNRQFEAFRRKEKGMEKMFSRIEELLVNTGNLDKIYGGIDHQTKPENFEDIQQASLDYIKKVVTDAI